MVEELLSRAAENILDEERVDKTIDHRNRYLQSIACSLLVIASLLHESTKIGGVLGPKF